MVGTGLKMFVDRMRAPTDRQSKSLDYDLQKAGVLTPEGQVMTSIDIQKMVQTDFKQALNLMSKLYVEGAIRQKTMADMVGTRHMSTVSRLLTQVDGNIDAVNKKYLNQQNLMENSGKSLESWSTELEKMKNSFRSLKVVALDSSDALKGLVSALGTVGGKLGEFAGTPSGSSIVQTGMLGLGTAKVTGQLALASVTAQTISSLSKSGNVIGTVTENLSGMSKSIKGLKIGNILGLGRVLNNAGSAAGGAGTAFGGLTSILKTGMGVVLGLIKALAPWIIAIGLAIYSFKKWQEHIAKENKLRKESLDTIDATIISMQAYDQAMKQMNNALSTLSFSLGSSSNDIMYMSDTLRELQRELRVTQREMNLLNFTEVSERYRQSLEEQYAEALGNSRTKDSTEQKIDKMVEMLSKALDVRSSIDENKIKRARSEMESVGIRFTGSVFSDAKRGDVKDEGSAVREIAELIGSRQADDISAFLSAYEFLYSSVEESAQVNSTILQKSSNLFLEHTRVMKNTFGEKTIVEILRENEKAFSSYFLSKRKMSENELKALSEAHGQDVVFAMRQEGMLTEYLDTKKFINKEQERVYENISKFSSALGIDIKDVTLKNYGGEIKEAFDEVTKLYNDRVGSMSDDQLRYLERHADALSYMNVPEGGSEIRRGLAMVGISSELRGGNRRESDKPILREMSKILRSSTSDRDILSQLSVMYSEAGDRRKQAIETEIEKYMLTAFSEKISIDEVMEIIRHDYMDKGQGSKLFEGGIEEVVGSLQVYQENKNLVKERIGEMFKEDNDLIIAFLSSVDEELDGILREIIFDKFNVEDPEKYNSIIQLKQSKDFQKHLDILEKVEEMNIQIVKTINQSSYEIDGAIKQIQRTSKYLGKTHSSAGQIKKHSKELEKIGIEIQKTIEPFYRALLNTMDSGTKVMMEAIEADRNALVKELEELEKELEEDIDKILSDDINVSSSVSRSEMLETEKRISEIKQRLESPVNYSDYAEYGDYKKAEDDLLVLDEGIRKLQEMKNRSVDELAEMTYDQFVKEVSSAFPMKDVEKKINELKEDLKTDPENKDLKKELEYYQSMLSMLGEDSLSNLFEVIVGGRVRLAEEMGVTQGDIRELSREIEEFNRDMKRSRLSIDKIGLSGLPSEFYDIYQGFQEGITLVNTQTLDSLRETYENSLEKISGPMDLEGLSIDKLDEKLKQEEDEKRRRVIKDRIKFLKEEQKIQIEKNKVQKQTLHDLIMFQRNLRKEIVSARRDAGIAQPVSDVEAGNARARLQHQRLTQISFMESLKAEAKGVSGSDLNALITKDADVKDFDLTLEAEHYIRQLQLLNLQMEDNTEILDRHSESLNNQGKVLSETQKRQNEVTKAMNAYAKSMTPENFLALQDAAEDALISMQTETLKAVNEIAGVFSQSEGMQHIITQTNLKIIEQELEVLESTKHRYDSTLDYEKRILILQAKRVQADLQARKEELEHKKNVIDLEKQIRQTQDQRNNLRGLGSAVNPFADFSRALKDSIDSYRKDMEMMQIEKDMEFKAMEFMKENSISVDKNTLAIEQNTAILSKTKEDTDINIVMDGLAERLRKNGVSEDEILSIQEGLSQGEIRDFHGLSSDDIKSVWDAAENIEKIKEANKSIAKTQEAQRTALEETHGMDLENIKIMKKREWALKEKLRREQLLTELEQQRNDVIQAALGKHKDSIQMLDAILKNDYSAYEANNSSLEGIIGGALHIGMIPKQQEAIQKQEQTAKKELDVINRSLEKIERIPLKDGLNKDIYEEEKNKLTEERLAKEKEINALAKDSSALNAAMIQQAVETTAAVIQYIGNEWFANEQRILEASIKRLENEREILNMTSELMQSREAKMIHEQALDRNEKALMEEQFKLQDSQANQATFNKTVNMASQGATIGAAGGPIGIAIGAGIGGFLGFMSGKAEKEALKKEQERQREFFEMKKQVEAMIRLSKALEEYGKTTEGLIEALMDYAEETSMRGGGTSAIREKSERILNRVVSDTQADSVGYSVRHVVSNPAANKGVWKTFWDYVNPWSSNEPLYVDKTSVGSANIEHLEDMSGMDRGETIKENIEFFDNLAKLTEDEVKEYLESLGYKGVKNWSVEALTAEINKHGREASAELRRALTAWTDAITTVFYTGMEGFESSSRVEEEKAAYEKYETDMELADRMRDRKGATEEDKRRADAIAEDAERALEYTTERIEEKYGDSFVLFSSVFSRESFQKILEGANLGKNFSDATVSAISSSVAMINKNLRGKLFESIYSASGIADRLDESVDGITTYLKDLYLEDQESEEKGNRFADAVKSATEDGVLDLSKLASDAGVEDPWEIFNDQMKLSNKFGKIDMFKTSEKFQSDMKENLEGVSSSQARQAAIQAGLADTWADALNYMSDTNDSLRALRAATSREKLAWEESGNKDRLESLRIDRVAEGDAFTGVAELEQLEAEFTRLEFKEHVYSQFQAGVDKALDAKNYTERMSAFGSLFEETFKKTLRSRIGLSDEEMEGYATGLEDALYSQDYDKVGGIMDSLSRRSIDAEAEIEDFRQGLLDRGYLDTQIDAMFNISSKYKEISEHLREGTVLSKEMFSLEKQALDYQTERVKYKGQEIDRETLIKDLLIQQAEDRLDDGDLHIIENYEKTMAKIALHKQIITELPSQIFDISQNLSNIDGLMSTIATAYKENMLKQHHEFIAGTGQELTEKISNNDWHGAYQTLTKVNNKIHNQANFLQQERLKMLDDGMLSDDIDRILGTTSKYKEIASELDPRKILGRTFFEIEKKQIDLNKNQVEYNGKIIETERLVSNLLQAQAEGVELNEKDLNIITQYYNTVEKIERRKNLGNHIAQSIQNAFKASEYTKTFEAFAGGIGSILQDRITKSITKGMEPQLNQLLNTTDMAIDQMSISGLHEAQQQMLMLSARTEAMRKQYAGITDMFSNKFMEFNDTSREINYQSASSKEVTYINNYTTQLNAGALIGDGVSMERLAKTLAPHIDKALKKLR